MRRRRRIASALKTSSMGNIEDSIHIFFFSRYLTTFKYIHLRAQEDADRRGTIDKEYVWPLSFPDCTPQLRK